MFRDASPISAVGFVRAAYRRACRARRMLVVHIHNPSLAPIGIAVRMFCPQAKVVVNLHNDWRYFKAHQRFGLRVLARVCDHLIPVSHAIVQTIPPRIRTTLQAEEKLTAIPNGIPSTKLRQMARTDSGDASAGQTHGRRPHAVVVARMVPQKNYPLILRVLKETPEIEKLIWFGDGYLRPELEQQVKHLGIEDRIELKGVRPRHEVLRALSEASIYIAASKWEGIGVANLEAAALGCYPFLSHIAPHEEIAQRIGVETLPLDREDIWTARIGCFLGSDPVEREMLRDEVAARTVQHFDLVQSTRDYIQLYHQLALLSRTKPIELEVTTA